MLHTTKPYLIRAIYEWCQDQGFTPHLQVMVDNRSRVPREHVRDGQIVLNVGSAATNQLVLGNEDIQFQARFSGAVFSVLVPVDAVAAIYARENGQGMAFDVESPGADGSQEKSELIIPQEDSALVAEEPKDPKPPGKPSHLTRIK